jgi:hypothetical protein
MTSTARLHAASLGSGPRLGMSGEGSVFKKMKRPHQMNDSSSTRLCVVSDPLTATVPHRISVQDASFSLLLLRDAIANILPERFSLGGTPCKARGDYVVAGTLAALPV